MLAGIREILIITTPEDQDRFVRLLGDGSRIGMSFSYAVQPQPDGLAQAFIIGREFVGSGRCALILGDNIFYGTGLTADARSAPARATGCTVFAYHVTDPERYGVVEFDPAGKRRRHRREAEGSQIELGGDRTLFLRQPRARHRRQPQAFGARRARDHRRQRCLSRRGELNVERMGRGFAWLDTGTPDSLLDAAEFVRTIEQRQGWMIACIEEIAYRSGFIDAEQLLRIAASLKNTYYGRYLETVAHEARHQY